MPERRKIIPEYVSRDVRTVREEALAVITIEPNGQITTKENLRGRLGVIAVVGPTSDNNGNFYKEALLAEIGLCDALPYKRGQLSLGWGTRRRKRQKRVSITRRWDYFRLSKKQYDLVSQDIFRVIQKLVDRRIASWNTWETTYWSVTMHLPVTNSRRPGMNRGSTFRRSRCIPRGIRVVFPGQQDFFRPDLYWAEQQSLVPQGRVREFAFWVRNRVRQYEKGFRSRNFRTLVGFRSVIRLLASTKLPYHLRIEALNQLPGGSRYALRSELEDLFRWTGNGDRPKWRVLASQAVRPKKRLSGLNLQVQDDNQERIVCIFYPVRPERFVNRRRRLDLEDAECPF